MAISKTDCILLLAEIGKDGIDTKKMASILLSEPGVPTEVLKFINDNRQMDLTNFYEKLRKNYNAKKSPLYMNLLRGEEDTQTVLTTLSALLLQVTLFSKQVEDREMFLRHARAQEITEALYNYYTTYDLIPCIKLLRLIKCDIKAIRYLLDQEIAEEA